VLQVQGAFGAAREECLTLEKLTHELVSAACLASVNGASGNLRESYEQLRAALNRQRYVQPEIRVWVLTSLAAMAARMAARAGMAEEAQSHSRAALALDETDNYLLGAYADFLLDTGQPQEAATLLKDKTRVDPLLLR
jgi:predicted Zn-dependent protease